MPHRDCQARRRRGLRLPDGMVFAFVMLSDNILRGFFLFHSSMRFQQGVPCLNAKWALRIYPLPPKMSDVCNMLVINWHLFVSMPPVL